MCHHFILVVRWMRLFFFLSSTFFSTNISLLRSFTTLVRSSHFSSLVLKFIYNFNYFIFGVCVIISFFLPTGLPRGGQAGHFCGCASFFSFFIFFLPYFRSYGAFHFSHFSSLQFTLGTLSQLKSKAYPIYAINPGWVHRKVCFQIFL